MAYTSSPRTAAPVANSSSPSCRDKGPFIPDARQSRSNSKKIFVSRATNYRIQAASENLSIKQNIFRTLSAELSPKTILATNTSSISITKIAASTIPEGKTAADPEGKESASRVVGLHFFNPVPVMVRPDSCCDFATPSTEAGSSATDPLFIASQKLVELIAAVQTSEETLERARAYATACGKGASRIVCTHLRAPLTHYAAHCDCPSHRWLRMQTQTRVVGLEVTYSKDVPGFVANGLLMPFINEVRGLMTPSLAWLPY